MPTPIRYSHFDLGFMRELVNEHYPQIAQTEYELYLWNSGFNLLYLLQTEQAAWMLRLRPSYAYYNLNEENVKFVLDFQDYLYRNNFPTPEIVRTANNRKFGRIDAPEGPRYFSLHRVVPGEPLYPLSQDQLLQVGRYLAVMHQLSIKYQPQYRRLYFSKQQMLDVPLSLFYEHSHLFEDKKDWFEKVITRAVKFIGSFDFDDFVIVHGDFWHGNFLMDENRTYFIDFDFGCYGPKELDLASFLVLGFQREIRGDADLEKMEQMFEYLLSGYLQQWPQSIDMGLLMELAIARTIWTIGGYLSARGIQTRSYVQTKVNELLAVLGYLVSENRQ